MIYTATHCNELQRTATDTATHYARILLVMVYLRIWWCTLQHTPTNCKKLQHTATYRNTSRRDLVDDDVRWYMMIYTATHCNTLCKALVADDVRAYVVTYTATHCSTLRKALVDDLRVYVMLYTATNCSTLQQIAAHCNTMQHIVQESPWLSCTCVCRGNHQRTTAHYNKLQHTAAHCVDSQTRCRATHYDDMCTCIYNDCTCIYNHLRWVECVYVYMYILCICILSVCMHIYSCAVGQMCRCLYVHSMCVCLLKYVCAMMICVHVYVHVLMCVRMLCVHVYMLMCGGAPVCVCLCICLGSICMCIFKYVCAVMICVHVYVLICIMMIFVQIYTLMCCTSVSCVNTYLNIHTNIQMHTMYVAAVLVQICIYMYVYVYTICKCVYSNMYVLWRYIIQKKVSSPRNSVSWVLPCKRNPFLNSRAGLEQLDIVTIGPLWYTHFGFFICTGR